MILLDEHKATAVEPRSEDESRSVQEKGSAEYITHTGEPVGRARIIELYERSVDLKEVEILREIIRVSNNLWEAVTLSVGYGSTLNRLK